VAVLGTNFVDSPSARVRFDNIDVMPVFHGPRTLICTAPPHHAGTPRFLSISRSRDVARHIWLPQERGTDVHVVQVLCRFVSRTTPRCGRRRRRLSPTRTGVRHRHRPMPPLPDPTLTSAWTTVRKYSTITPRPPTTTRSYSFFADRNGSFHYLFNTYPSVRSNKAT
jgi:hypothetical protein